MTDRTPVEPWRPQAREPAPPVDPPSADSDAWRPAYPPAMPPQPQGTPHPGTIYPPPAYLPSPTAYPPAGYPPASPYLHGATAGAAPPPFPAHRPATSQRRGGIFGGLIAGLFAFLKYGLIFFKFGKFGATAISMLIALFIYAQLFGLPFAVGVVVLIFIHEMGHYLVSKSLGIAVSAPLFLGPFGAFTSHKDLGKDRRIEALIAIGGPVFGFLATLLLYLFALSQTDVTHTVALAYALSYFGFLITLFNLIPFSPLDGGRVAGAISKWTNVAGLAIFAAVLLFMLNDGAAFNPFLLLIFLIGLYSVWNRFKQAREGREPPPLPASTRAWLAGAYIALVVFSALGMSLAHGALIDHGFVVT